MDWKAFWPFYLQEHADGRNRAMHLIGTTLAFLCLVGLVAFPAWWWVPLGLVAGYAFAWVGHYGFEKNRPATFKHPFKSLASDWRMWALALTGRLRREYERHGIKTR